MIKKAIIFSIIFILYSCNSMEIKRQKLIVPENYVGDVFIFYGQKFDRGESQKKGSTVSFYVPDDGVIFTKYKPASFMNVEEYFQNTQKNLSKINNKTKEIIIIGTSLNGIGAPFQMDCSQYIVGLKKDVSTKSSRPTHFIDSLYLSYADSQGNPK